MGEQPKTLNFLPSYLLDLIYFLELLIGPHSVLTSTEDDACLHHYEDCLSDYAKEEIKRVQKVLPKNKTLSEMVMPLILADHEFENFQMTELLEGQRYLISLYKKSPDYTVASKQYKKFVTKDAHELMGALMMIVAELERVGFKRFWLEKRLPQINETIRNYEQQIGTNTLIEKVNEVLGEPLLSTQTVYLLSFNVNPRVVKVGDFMLGSLRLDAHAFTHALLEGFLNARSIEAALKPFERALKKNKELIQAYRQVKGEYKSLGAYVSSSVKIAFGAYLSEKLGVLEQPQVYLKDKSERALLYYDQMLLSPKEKSQSIEAYLIAVVTVVELHEEKRG